MLGVAFLLLLAYPQRQTVWNGRNDFVAFYTGAKLVGTPDLYSRSANIATIGKILGVALDGTTYVRPPFYAALLKPLAMLPYRVAYRLFLFASLASILWFVIRFAKERVELPLFAALGMPLLIPLCNGQDTPLLLTLLGGFVVLLRSKRDFTAGLVLSLCAIKFHLFLFVAALLFLKKRWRAVGGGASGIAALTAFGVLAAGFDSYRQWVSVMRDPWISPDDWALPNIHGLVLTFHGNFYWELALAGVVALAFLWMVLRSGNFEFLLGVSLVCGLLTSFHSGYSDDVLLYPVFVLAVGATTASPLRIMSAMILRIMSAMILLPIPYLLELMGRPYSSILPLLLLAWMAAAVVALSWKGVVPGVLQPAPTQSHVGDVMSADLAR